LETKEFENIEKSTTTMNENSTTMMNATLPMSFEGNDTAKPMNQFYQCHGARMLLPITEQH
jgi:hypothetical protein